MHESEASKKVSISKVSAVHKGGTVFAARERVKSATLVSCSAAGKKSFRARVKAPKKKSVFRARVCAKKS